MKRAMVVLSIVLALVPCGLKLYWREYWKNTEAGAVVGARYSLRFKECTGVEPSAKTVKEMSHYVNNPDELPCSWFYNVGSY